MKKKMLFVMTTIAAFILFVPGVWAAEVEVDGTTVKLADAISAANDGDVIKLTDDIALTSKIEIRKDITIDGGNNTITSTAGKIFEIYGTASNTTVVTIEDVTMEMSASNARCVDTRTGSIELTLNGVILTTTGEGNNQPITIGNTYADGEKNNVINLVDTIINAGNSGYAIIVFNPINLTVNSSDLSGYGTLYFKGVYGGSIGSAGSVVTVKDSKLTATSHKGEAFGTVVFEDNDIKVDVIDSIITANTVENSEFSAFKWNALNGKYNYLKDKDGNIISEEAVEEIEGNKVTVSGKSEIKSSGNGTSQIAKTGSENTVVIETGVTSDLEISTDYLPEGTKVEEDKDGNLVVVPDAIVLTLTGVHKGVVIPEATAQVKDILKGTVLTDEEIEELDTLTEELNDELIGEGLMFVGFYSDKEGTKKVDFTKVLDSDVTWYMVFADAVRTVDGEYILLEDAVCITPYIIVNGKLVEEGTEKGYFKKGEVLSKEMQENFENLDEMVKEEFKEDGYVYLGVFYDKEGKNKLDFTKILNEDEEWYLFIGPVPEEKPEELPPKTGDINLVILIGTILVGAAGAVIVSKKRFAKSN